MINHILRFSIERRYFIVSLLGLVVIAGIWSYQKLPIDAVPDITNVQVQINTHAPGYSPLEAEQRITYPIETALSGLPNLAYTRSISRYGLSQVTVVFNEDTDIHFARNNINIELNALKTKLPENIAPQIGPISTGLGEIFMYTLRAAEDARQPNGSPYNAIALREIQDWIIKPQLSQVKGVVEINSIGGYAKQYHITPWPQKLLQFQLSWQDVVNALEANNVNRGAGYIETNGQQILVRSASQLKSPDDIANIIVKSNHGIPVKIADIADIIIGKELRTGAATQNGSETVLGTAMMLIGENSRTVAKNVAKQLTVVQASLPQGIYVEAVYDRTTLVNKAIATVSKNLLEGALLVIVVLFVLLGNIRAALITAAVIPIVMLITITGMVKAGVSANLMSLGALDFGLIVDGAVIIVENATRRLAQAQQKNTLTLKERLDTVFRATHEVIRPSLFGIAIITVVYVPLFSLSGVEGKMFHPMASTVVIAMLAAMVVSLTLVPAAVAIFLHKKININDSPIIKHTKSAYKPILLKVLRHPVKILSVAIALVMASVFFGSKLGKEFIPQLDEGDIALHALRIPGTGIDQAVSMQAALEKRIKTFPEVERVFGRLGTAEIATDPMPPNVADNFVILKPRELWPNPKKTKVDLIAEIEASLKQLPGNNYEFTQPIQMRFNELISGVRADLGIKVFGDDLDQLVIAGNAILQQINQIEGVADARVEQIKGLPTLAITPKLSVLGRYDLTALDLQNWIATAIGGQNAGLMYEGDRRFELIVRLPEVLRTDIDNLKYLPVPLASGGYVLLYEVATIALAPAPAQISRENGKRRIVVTANIRGRDLGSFVAQAKQVIGQNITLPPGYWLKYGGTFEQMESASQRLMVVVPLTLIIIFSALIMAFGSIKDAFIIFTGVPLALTGGVFALLLRDMPLSMSAGVGFIALSGIAVLNGLVMLAFIRELWQGQYTLTNAIVEGALTRLRPVLMTGLVASLGFIPMAFNIGTGAEVQRPLATVVIGGILSSTVLTLFVLPALYLLLHRGDARPNR
ncbi:efflux RND transporter permease subunit [Marinagarivorans cellulosilyticus]|uniref:Cobalt-zinc-cadmium resistance protein CzcA n=1 Tax=Marinagarivorans cellulosilyticus TaxID=2721545 RepID=A0AAN1WJF8_9GAMM|nr:CusA/CzcA family heavy metal efflux RND transporter [Marinagarivorans cellulosilyticus]BCD98726.1 cobalt-zinc-cadmium resistance protein CzcA [Marinagarivorans cellulosilyticus]